MKIIFTNTSISKSKKSILLKLNFKNEEPYQNTNYLFSIFYNDLVIYSH